MTDNSAQKKISSTELLKKVRKIEIKTRGLTKQIFAGEYHSAFKGRGMAFSEVREYQFGDDVRSIDWNVTARFNHPYIKIFEEERELTVMLLIDVSGSGDFGSVIQQKHELMTELAAVLSFSAIQNNDKIGIIFFSDKIEKFIPPKGGRKHILRIIRELLDFVPENTKTNVSQALRYFTNVVKKRTTAFIISDFICDDFLNALKISSYKHDLIALKIFDKREGILPNMGLVSMLHPESKEKMLVDTSNRKQRRLFEENYKSLQSRNETYFRKCGVDFTAISTESGYVKPLKQLFKNR